MVVDWFAHDIRVIPLMPFLHRNLLLCHRYFFKNEVSHWYRQPKRGKQEHRLDRPQDPKQALIPVLIVGSPKEVQGC